MPPGPFCPECQSQQIDWAELSGEGVLFSFAVCHRSPFPGKVADFTYVPAVVSLPDAGGVRLVSNLIDVEPESIRIDMPLQVVFSEIAGGWKVPLFRPTRGS